MRSRREALADRYDTLLAKLPLAAAAARDDRRSAWHLYAVEIDAARTPVRREAASAALREAGIGVNVHCIPIHTQPHYQRPGFARGDFPAAEALLARIALAATVPGADAGAAGSRGERSERAGMNSGRIAVIPARGGSKRAAQNLRPFAGRPMIGYAIGVAQRSGLFERIVVRPTTPRWPRWRTLGADVPFCARRTGRRLHAHGAGDRTYDPRLRRTRLACAAGLLHLPGRAAAAAADAG